jgi:hypothetical protein
MRTDRLNDPDPTVWYPSDDDEATYKCDDCGCELTESEAINAAHIYYPDGRRTFVPMCKPCYNETLRLDSEQDRAEEIERDLKADIMQDVLNDIKKLGQ